VGGNASSDSKDALGPSPATRSWLKALAKIQHREIRLVVLGGTLVGVFTVAQMAGVAWLVYGAAIGQQSVGLLWPAILMIIVAIAGRAGAQILQARAASVASSRVRSYVRNQLFVAWSAAGPQRSRMAPSATQASEWLDLTDALHGYYARFLPQTFLCLIVPVLILAVVFPLDWVAGALLLLTAPLIPLFMALVGMGAEQINQEHFRTLGRLSGQFLDRIRGLTTLQIFQRTAPAADQLSERTDQFRRITLKTLRIAFLSSAVLEFFSSIAIAVVAMYIGFGLLGFLEFGPASELNLFTGLFILLLAPEFFQPLRQLSQHYHDRAAAVGAASQIQERLDQLATAEAEADPDHVDAQPRNTHSAVEITHLEFAHASAPPSLRLRALSLAWGQTLVVTGASGSGKTTLLNLLAGFLKPTAGTITVLGHEPGAVPIGWLGQRPFILQGTWEENLKWAAPEATERDMLAALETVGLKSLLDQRPLGLKSPLSDDGGGLSGGQARRLALARALLGQHPLMLLDEPSAGLDRDSEAAVIKGLKALAESGRTLVIATHHHAVVEMADSVIRIEDSEANHV